MLCLRYRVYVFTIIVAFALVYVFTLIAALTQLSYFLPFIPINVIKYPYIPIIFSLKYEYK